MKMLKILIKKDLQIFLNLIKHPKQSFSDKETRQKIIAGIFISIFFMIYLLMSNAFIKFLFENTKGTDFDAFIYTNSFIAVLAFSAIFSLGYMIAGLYLSNEISILDRLPIKSSTVITYHMIEASIVVPLLSLLIVLPATYHYARLNGEGILFYLMSITNYFSSGMIALGLMTIASILIMRLANKLPNIKSIIQVFGMILVIGFTVGIQVISRNFQGGFEIDENTAMTTITNFNPPTFLANIKLIKLGLEGDSLTRLMVIGLNLLIISLILYLVPKLMDKMYTAGKSDNKVTLSKKKAVKENNFKKTSSKLSIMKREILSIVKEPYFLYNVGVVGLIFPLILGASIGPAKLNEMAKYYKEFTAPMSEIQIALIACIFGPLISLFIANMGQSSLSSLTREGKSFWLSRVLPISPKDQVDGRLMASVFFEFINVLFMQLGIIYFIKPSFLVALFLILGSTIPLLTIACTGLLVDILKPKLDWNSPKEAFKGNWNIAIYAGVSYFVSFILIGIGILVLGTFREKALEYIHYVVIISSVLILALGVFMRNMCIEFWRKKYL